MPFKFNPLTGTLDLVNTTTGGSSSGVSSLNGETGDITIEGSGSVVVSTSGTTVTIAVNSYMPGGW